MEKTRELFKKIRDTKGTFHAKMSTIKDRNGTDLTEADDIQKRWQEYTEELYNKDLHDPENHEGVITLSIIFLLTKSASVFGTRGTNQGLSQQNWGTYGNKVYEAS